MRIPEDLIALMEKADFTVTAEGAGIYTFGKYSSRGQDFDFRVQTEDNLDYFKENILAVYSDFDVSAEAYNMLDSEGHGVNGAPYEMEDVLADVKECREFIYELWEIVNGYTPAPEKRLWVVCLNSEYIRNAEMVDTTSLTDKEFEDQYFFMDNDEEQWHEMEPNAFIGICNAVDEDEACSIIAKKYRYDQRCLYAIKAEESCV